MTETGLGLVTLGETLLCAGPQFTQPYREGVWMFSALLIFASAVYPALLFTHIL